MSTWQSKITKESRNQGEKLITTKLKTPTEIRHTVGHNTWNLLQSNSTSPTDRISEPLWSEVNLQQQRCCGAPHVAQLSGLLPPTAGCPGAGTLWPGAATLGTSHTAHVKP